MGSGSRCRPARPAGSTDRARRAASRGGGHASGSRSAHAESRWSCSILPNPSGPLVKNPGTQTSRAYASKKTAARGHVRAAVAQGGSTAQPGVLQLLVDTGGELVQPLVHRHFLGHHLLQRLRPLGGEVEEQRLGREVDLGAGRRDVVLLEIARIGLVDAGAELLVLPDRGADRIDEVHLAGAEQIMLDRGGPLHEVPGGVLL